MEFLIVFVICFVIIILLGIIYGFNLKKIKQMANIKRLDDIVDKYPENIGICKEILKKIDNENVGIEENKDSDATVYIAISNKIFIGNLKKSYTRIQTIAHECLHSIQNRRILLFNFIFSNIYLIYFVLIVILKLFNKLNYEMTYLVILSIFGSVYYSIRMYLESDAMIKARFLAKEYMEEKNISEKFEIDEIVNQYDIVNDIGIRCVNYQMLFGILVKIMIFALICFII